MIRWIMRKIKNYLRNPSETCLQELSLCEGTTIRKYAVSDGAVMIILVVNYDRFILRSCQRFKF